MNMVTLGTKVVVSYKLNVFSADICTLRNIGLWGGGVGRA